MIVAILPIFPQHPADFILQVAEKHLATIVGFGVPQRNKTAAPAIFLVQLISTPHVAHELTLHFPLYQSYSNAGNSFSNPSISLDVHPDFVVPLSSFRTLRDYSAAAFHTPITPAKPLFEKYRNRERRERKCTHSVAEQRGYGIYGMLEATFEIIVIQANVCSPAANRILFAQKQMPESSRK